MKNIIFMLLVFLTMSNVAMSSGNVEYTTVSFSIWGLKDQQCGDYLSDRQSTDNNSYKGRVASVYFSYYMGLRTGYNMATSGSQSEGVVSQATVISYLDNFCRTNPLSPLFKGFECLLQSSGVGIKSKSSCE